jgi:outer membrane immunogenic protein
LNMSRRKLAIGAFVFALYAMPVFAADLPQRTPAATPYLAPAPVYSWTGFYVGANIGGAWGAGCNATAPNFPGIGVGWANAACGAGGNSNGTFIGGLQAGYNWQSGSFVYGVEADIQGLSNSGGGTTTVAFPGIVGVPAGNYVINSTRDPNMFGTARLRLGYAADRALFYITGGLAYGSGSRATGVNYWAGPVVGAPTATFAAASNGNAIGWTIGIGAEYAFANNWTVRAEYLFADLGKNNGNTAVCAGACAGFNPALTWGGRGRDAGVSIARVGLNYKFGGNSIPIIASY